MDLGRLFALAWGIVAVAMGIFSLRMTAVFVELIQHRYVEYRMSRLADKLAPPLFLTIFIRVLGVALVAAGLVVFALAATGVISSAASR